ncbi:MAG: hypothetical protein LBG59_06170 [Candidatus Peribacteria bacterium]|nr:hypothetical protein [Candidatus Peribacteria bacterium]
MIHRENETIRVQPRNLYNFIGNSSLMGLLPRLEGSYTTIETLYQQKSHLLQQL